jgi:thioredoxin 1
MLTLTDDNFKKEVLESKIPVMVDFGATWCPPCRAMEPAVEASAKEYQEKIKIGKLNIEEAPEVASQYKIMSIPALIFFKGGKEVSRLVGLQTKETIKEQLDKLL